MIMEPSATQHESQNVVPSSSPLWCALRLISKFQLFGRAEVTEVSKYLTWSVFSPSSTQLSLHRIAMAYLLSGPCLTLAGVQNRRPIAGGLFQILGSSTGLVPVHYICHLKWFF